MQWIVIHRRRDNAVHMMVHATDRFRRKRKIKDKLREKYVKIQLITIMCVHKE